MAIHAMIDLETLGTRPDGVILSIGGVKFDPNSDKIYDEFHYRLEVDEQIDRGRSVDEGTVEWWGKQPAEVVEAAFGNEGRISIDEFLDVFKRWCVSADTFWSQGPTFDMVMLENLYLQYGKHYPWSFWQVRDSRTLFSVCKEDPRKKIQNDLHNALADAYYQSKAIQIAYKELGVTR